MNKVIIMGRLTKDPEVRETGEGKAYARLTVAVDRVNKSTGQNADFISCVAFNKTAEIIRDYCKRGTKICIDGHIQTGSYDKDGRKVFTTDVVIEHFEFAESKKAAEQPDSGFTAVDPMEDEGLPFN